MKTVSIIIPCYNVEAYLREAIESALSQTVTPREVVVIDDGSTDSSAAIAESFCEPVYVIRQKNSGESSARNAGIKRATGDYLLFLDADDLLHAESIERLLSCVQNSELVTVCMNCSFFRTNPEEPFRITKPAKTFFPTVISSNINPIHCWLFPRQILLDLGGFLEGQYYFEDWHLVCRFALKKIPLVTIDFSGAYYRVHSRQQSETADSLARALGRVEVQRTLAEGILSDDELLEKYSNELFWSGWTALEKARGLGAAWEDVADLVNNLEWLTIKSPASLRKSWFAGLTRFVGLRWASRIRDLVILR